MFHPLRFPDRRNRGYLWLSLVSAMFLTLSAISSPVTATPSPQSSDLAATAQNVDWMSAEMARSLDLGFGVWVPTHIPAPFTGSPSVSASGGYYSLYWMAGGGSPTFLEISGTVGGSLPAGSPADLNNELFINANVQGYDAIHDQTAIYDAVWWIAGGVLYEVNALNLSVDSLSLANSLVTLVPPEPEPEPEPEPAEPPVEEPAAETPDSGAAETPATDAEETTEAGETPAPDPLATVVSDVGAIIAPASVTAGDSVTIVINGAEAADLIASAGVFSDEGDNGIVDVQDGDLVWESPLVEIETTVTFDLLVSATGEVIDQIEITVFPRQPGEPFRGTDGTDGPSPPVIGSDGTGGVQDVIVPPESP